VNRVVAVLLVLGVWSTGCRWTGPVTAPWVLTDPPHGTELHVEALIGGTSCTELVRWQVTEDDEQVEILAVLARSDPGDCTDDIGSASQVVRLADPLGDRDLVGCTGNDPELSHIDETDQDRDCAELRSDA
jgi:hypothetical protein